VFDGRWRRAVDEGVAPVGSRLGALGDGRVRPNHLTALGLVFAVGCAFAVASGHLLIGLALLIASALPDLLDGALAKAQGTVSVQGAFFDSVADRVADSLVLAALAWYLSRPPHPRHLVVLPLAVMGVATLVSYQRAKAESLGLDAKGGLMERAERIVALCVGLAFPVTLVPVLWVMLGATTATAAFRFAKVWRQAPGPTSGMTPAPNAAPARAGRRHSLHRDRLRPELAVRWREWRAERLPWRERLLQRDRLPARGPDRTRP